MRHKTLFRVHCPVPGPSRSDPPGVLPGKVDKICGGHGQGETPGPIPNPEAKALHGDGTAPERVWESSAPPLSHDTVPPGRAPTGSRGVPRFPPTVRDTGVPPAFISPYISSYSYSSIYIFVRSLPVSRHSPAAPLFPLPIRPSVLREGGRLWRAHGGGGARAPADTEGCAAGPACPARARRRDGRAGKQGRPQGVHVPFLSWIAAGGTRCIHQVRE